MKNYFDVTGRAAVITGCSTGLGVEMAKALASQGCRIVCLARRREKVEENAALFLSSPMSTYVNGAILPVDSGYTCM